VKIAASTFAIPTDTACSRSYRTEASTDASLRIAIGPGAWLAGRALARRQPIGVAFRASEDAAAAKRYAGDSGEN
jgi:hypothetical protein